MIPLLVGQIDTHVDVLHPHLFHADAGVYRWVDRGGDGWLTPGVDGVDLDGDGRISDQEVLQRLSSAVFSGESTDRPDRFDPARDGLFLDLNGDGRRNAGAGFSEDTPALGEPLFVAADLDDDGWIATDETITRLGSSVVRAVLADRIYTRGRDLLDYAALQVDRTHGTAMAGILVGAGVGQGAFPSGSSTADLLFVAREGRTSEADYAAAVHWLHDQGATLVLHEHAPRVGWAPDGTGPVADALATGTHVCPVGNLGGLGKHAVFTGPFTVGLELVAPTIIEVHGEVACDGPGERRTSAGGTHTWRTARTTSGTLTCDGPAELFLDDGLGWEAGSRFDPASDRGSWSLLARMPGCQAVMTAAPTSSQGDALLGDDAGTGPLAHSPDWVVLHGTSVAAAGVAAQQLDAPTGPSPLGGIQPLPTSAACQTGGSPAGLLLLLPVLWRLRPGRGALRG